MACFRGASSGPLASAVSDSWESVPLPRYGPLPAEALDSLPLPKPDVLLQTLPEALDSLPLAKPDVLLEPLPLDELGAAVQGVRELVLPS